MQNVTFSEKLKQDLHLQRLAEQATPYLDGLINRWSTPMMNAEWDCREDEQGQPVVTLSLKEVGNEVTTCFDAKDFYNDQEMKHRIRRLWGELLCVPSDQLLGQLIDALPPKAITGRTREGQGAVNRWWTIVTPILGAVASVMVSALVAYLLNRK